MDVVMHGIRDHLLQVVKVMPLLAVRGPHGLYHMVQAVHLFDERTSPIFRDVRVFLNSLDRDLDLIRSAGIPCDLGREETEQEIVLTIRLPKTRPGKTA